SPSLLYSATRFPVATSHTVRRGFLEPFPSCAAKTSLPFAENAILVGFGLCMTVFFRLAKSQIQSSLPAEASFLPSGLKATKLIDGWLTFSFTSPDSRSNTLVGRGAP